MKPAGASTGLIFQWQDRRRALLLLPGFVLVSLFLHALAFYFFQASYPPSVSITPPPVQVSLLIASSPDYQALARWIDAEDPAAVMTSRAALPPNLLKIEYKPSFATVRGQPKPAGEESEPVRLPAAMPAPAYPAPALSKDKTVVKTSGIGPGVLRFSPALATRAKQPPPPPRLESRPAVPLLPARFLIGVSGRGEVRFIFPQSSSGDKAADRQAQAALERLAFDVDRQEITWGTATFYWGDNTPEGKEVTP